MTISYNGELLISTPYWLDIIISAALYFYFAVKGLIALSNHNYKRTQLLNDIDSIGEPIKETNYLWQSFAYLEPIRKPDNIIIKTVR